jgi:hypothetical protein
MEHVTNLSALANYIYLTTQDSSCGAIQNIFGEYCYIVGNLATTLYACIQADKEPQSGKVELQFADAGNYCCEIGTTQDTPEITKGMEQLIVLANDSNITQYIRNKEMSLVDCAEFIIGCMACCCLLDNTTIKKDKTSIKLQYALKPYADYLIKIKQLLPFTKADYDMPSEFVDVAIEMSHQTRKELWIIQDNTNTTYNMFDSTTQSDQSDQSNQSDQPDQSDDNMDNTDSDTKE